MSSNGELEPGTARRSWYAPFLLRTRQRCTGWSSQPAPFYMTRTVDIDPNYASQILTVSMDMCSHPIQMKMQQLLRFPLYSLSIWVIVQARTCRIRTFGSLSPPVHAACRNEYDGSIQQLFTNATIGLFWWILEDYSAVRVTFTEHWNGSLEDEWYPPGVLCRVTALCDMNQ